MCSSRHLTNQANEYSLLMVLGIEREKGCDMRIRLERERKPMTTATTFNIHSPFEFV